MATIICHHKGKYNLYSTISDGFVFKSALLLHQLEGWYKKEYGDSGMCNLPPRLQRAHEKGTSSLDDNSLEDFLICNRAGVDEATLSLEDCISQYLSYKGE
tara:strand:+ start:189 stop:491 length:303 start_codon:yes stop_codon:yes gene_type:complete